MLHNSTRLWKRGSHSTHFLQDTVREAEKNAAELLTALNSSARAHLTHGNRYNEELLTTISDVAEAQAAIKYYMVDMEVYLQVRNAAPRAANT